MEEKKFSLFPKGIDEERDFSASPAENKKQDDPVLREKNGEDSAYFHTMRTDAQRYVEDKDLSLINIFTKESKRASKRFEEEIKFKASFFVWLGVISISVLIIGFLGYKIFWGGKIKEEPRPAIPPPFIFSDQVKTIYLTNSNFEILVSEISEKFKDSYSLNNFTYFPIIQDNGVISSTDFLKGLKINITPELLKSVDKDFVFIIYTDDKSANHIIFGVKLISYDRAFKAMFELENEMPEKLQPIIISVKNNIISRKPEFADKVINNIDARVLETTDGKNIITYGFFGRRYLLITDSEEALKKSIERLKISLSE